jgi:hypothetical protein
MAPYKVREGLEVEFDFNKITISDWRILFDPTKAATEDDRIISQLTGIPVDTLGKLTVPEWKRLFKAVVKASNENTDPS